MVNPIESFVTELLASWDLPRDVVVNLADDAQHVLRGRPNVALTEREQGIITGMTLKSAKRYREEQPYLTEAGSLKGKLYHSGVIGPEELPIERRTGGGWLLYGKRFETKTAAEEFRASLPRNGREATR